MMRSVRAGTGRLGSFFAFYSSAPNPDRPEPSADRGTITSPRDGALGSVRWWWVLATGVGVGIMSYLLLYPVIFSYVLILSLLDRDVQSSVMQFGYAYGAWGMPMMHMLLMIFATFNDILHLASS